ncbi:MAG TPA: diacylglycerol kinase family protein, partial [Actinoplanes sp.]
MEVSALPKPSLLRRLCAAAALAAFGIALLVIVAMLLRSLIVLPLVLAGLVVAVLAGWSSLVCAARVRRWASLVLMAGALIATLVLLGVETITGMVVVLLLVVVSNAAARVALGPERALLTEPLTDRAVEQALHGVLLMNARSGGGKVERFGLVEEARRRGVEPVLLRPGDDLRALAEDAVAAGADVLGMAGGDGSQALVADVACRHDVAFVCVPAGTRNHFALDLGLDRADVAAALDAFGAAVERRVDLATVGGRVFVNNASLGVYATVVQSPAYRDAKLSTTVAMLPDMLGPHAPGFDLRYAGPDGAPADSADMLLVSNNPYAIRSVSGAGTRPRLDTGLLGIVAVRAETPAEVSTLLALETAGAIHRFRGFRQWTTPEFRIDSSQPVPVGVDGEALRMPPPLEFRILPGALRVRLPKATAGVRRNPWRIGEAGRSARGLMRVL